MSNSIQLGIKRSKSKFDGKNILKENFNFSNTVKIAQRIVDRFKTSSKEQIINKQAKSIIEYGKALPNQKIESIEFIKKKHGF